MNLEELMIQIRNNPGSILQDDCVFQLRAFMRGFVFAKNVHANGLTDDHKLMEGFSGYVREIYDIDPSEVISVEEIIYDHEQDESFEKHMELWFNYVNH